MALIQVKNLTFYYGGSYHYIFDNVSFRFDSHYKTALIGRNGRGKTTFLKLLMGEYEYQGCIIKSEDCVYFPYHVKEPSDWTINICYEIAPSLQQWQLEKELRYLKVDLEVLYRPFETLSQGEQTKVLLAILFLKEHSFLLIDEPTNHLDQESRQVVAQYLKKQKGFLLVSHDRYFIDQCCDHVIAIQPTSIEVVQGHFSSWYENKNNMDKNEQRRNEKLKKEISRLEEIKRNTSLWADQVEKTKKGHRISGLKPDRGYIGHKSAKMMQKSKNVERRQNKAIEEKRKLLKDREEYEDLKINYLNYYQETLLSFQYFSLFYQKQRLFKELTFCIHQYDRILLKGKNGCGKSSILRFIYNQNIEYKGEYYRGSQLKISYVPQDCSFLNGNLESIIEKYHVDETLVKTILRKFGFSREIFEIDLENYSEGQKKKVMLSISLATQAHLYIWDEPLNYIDIFSRIQIEKLILEYQPTLLFVEHDKAFQKKVATKIIDLDEVI